MTKSTLDTEHKVCFVDALAVEQVVCCRLTPVQAQLYKLLVRSKALKMELQKSKSGGISMSSLAFITQLKKLCNRKCNSQVRPVNAMGN